MLQTEHFGQAWCCLRFGEDNRWSWLPI